MNKKRWTDHGSPYSRMTVVIEEIESRVAEVEGPGGVWKTEYDFMAESSDTDVVRRCVDEMMAMFKGNQFTVTEHVIEGEPTD
jgi:hypothetical protein